MDDRSSSPKPLANIYIMSGLLEAFDWFDRALHDLLAERGIPYLTKTQSMIMLSVTIGMHRPIEIARRLRISRQAIRHAANQLVAMNLLEVVDDEHDKRGRRLVFHRSFAPTRKLAESIIRDLEAELRSRIGAENVETLDRILSMDWGEPVSSRDELK